MGRLGFQTLTEAEAIAPQDGPVRNVYGVEFAKRRRAPPSWRGPARGSGLVRGDRQVPRRLAAADPHDDLRRLLQALAGVQPHRDLAGAGPGRRPLGAGDPGRAGQLRRAAEGRDRADRARDGLAVGRHVAGHADAGRIALVALVPLVALVALRS